MDACILEIENNDNLVVLNLLNQIVNKIQHDEIEDPHAQSGDLACAKAIEHFDRELPNVLKIGSKTKKCSLERNIKLTLLMRDTLGIFRKCYIPLPPNYPLFEFFADRLKSHAAQQFYNKIPAKKTATSKYYIIARCAAYGISFGYFVAGAFCSFKGAALAAGASATANATSIIGSTSIAKASAASLIMLGFYFFWPSALLLLSFPMVLKFYEARQMHKAYVSELGKPMLCCEHFPALLISALDEENVLRPLYNAANENVAKQLLAEKLGKWIDDAKQMDNAFAGNGNYLVDAEIGDEV